jgi:hypothetical protein
LSANVIVMTPMQSIKTDNAQEKTRFVLLFIAPIAASGDNVYVTSWDNKTGNWELYFRASRDNGETFANISTLYGTNNS